MRQSIKIISLVLFRLPQNQPVLTSNRTAMDLLFAKVLMSETTWAVAMKLFVPALVIDMSSKAYIFRLPQVSSNNLGHRPGVAERGNNRRMATRATSHRQ